MASTAIEYRRASPGRQWFQRNMQGMMFWPLCLMLVWSMRGSSVAFLYQHAKNKGIDRAWWLDVGCLMAHVTLWVVIPTLFFGLSAIALYAGIWTIVGVSLSAVFAPAHIGMPIVQDAEDIWRLQFETTRNLTMPKWLSFFFIGLDYQIEHHIFPKIPHQKLPEVAKITKRWAHENQVPYHEIPYVGGLLDVTRFMGTSWQHDPTTVVEFPVTETNKISASAA